MWLSNKVAVVDLDRSLESGTVSRYLTESGAARVVLLDQAAAALEHTHARLEYSRTLVDLAHRCGARPLGERRAEAVAAGARPRRPFLTGVQALTPSELRVVRLASEGESNRDIAQSLFVTKKTVADHLRAAYRKLGVSRREELPNAMAERLPEAAAG